MAEVSARLASTFLGGDTGPGAVQRLTPREQEVLNLILTGQSNRQIAERLFLSPETVKTHVRHILAKTGASHKADLRTLLDALPSA